jgi:hypothetical protein
MGLSVNYGREELAPFVRSLRGTGYAGEALLFVANTADATRAWLAAEGVTAQPFETLPLLAMSMNSARMFRYLDHVLGSVIRPDGGSDYARVMLTDTRDVAFQGDPFASMGEAPATFFLERPGRTIGGCEHNAHWMRQAFGAAELARVAAEPVSCAGTLLATPQALLRYLLLMCWEILRAPPVARYSGIDQAIHNHILLHGLIPGAVAAANGGAVMTVPVDVAHGLVAGPDGVVRNPDGSVSAVLHQYDRDPVLKEAVEGRWRAG